MERYRPMTNDARDETILNMSVDIQKILSNQEAFKEAQNGHHKTLYGNGQPGICKRVDIMQERQDECRLKGRTNLVIAAVVVAVVMPLTVMICSPLIQHLYSKVLA